MYLLIVIFVLVLIVIFVLIGVNLGISIERKGWVRASESGQNHFVGMEYFRVVRGSREDCSKQFIGREQLNRDVDRICGLVEKGN